MLSLILVLLAFTPTSSVFASTNLNSAVEGQGNNNQGAVTQELINKVDKYISIKKDAFTISKKGLKTLTQNEKEIVLKSIEANNQLLEKVVDNDGWAKEGNFFHKTVTKTQSHQTGRVTGPNRLNAIPGGGGGRAYISTERTWWGLQIYFSPNAIEDFNDFFFYSSTASGLGAGTAVQKFFSNRGLSIATKFALPISLYGSGIAWGMSKVDNGNGVIV